MRVIVRVTVILAVSLTVILTVNVGVRRHSEICVGDAPLRLPSTISSFLPAITYPAPSIDSFLCNASFS